MSLLDRIVVPGLALVAALTLLLAGLQWHRAEKALTAEANTRTELADYRSEVQRNAAEASQKARSAEQKTRFLQQEALDAEHLARVAAEADAVRLRDSHGQLHRYATDLASSLDHRSTQDPATTGSCAAAEARVRSLAVVVGSLDDFAEAAVADADASRSAGQLCERTYDALTTE